MVIKTTNGTPQPYRTAHELCPGELAIAKGESNYYLLRLGGDWIVWIHKTTGEPNFPYRTCERQTRDLTVVSATLEVTVP